MNNRWCTGRSECAIPARFENLAYVLAFDVPKSNLRAEAVAFDQFSETDDYADSRKILFDLFLHLAEHTNDASEKHRGELPVPPIAAPARPIDLAGRNDSMSDIESEDDDDDGNDRPIGQAAAAAGDSSSSSSDSSDESDSDSEEDAGRSRSRRPVAADPGAADPYRDASGRGRGVDLLLEAVRSDSGVQNEYTDYRFWLLIYANEGRPDPNVEMERIVNESIRMNKRAYSGGAPLSSGHGLPRTPAPWESYMQIKSRDHMAQLLDLYAGQEHATTQNGVASKPVSDPENPICAEQLFSPMWAFKATASTGGRRALYDQSLWNHAQYFVRDPSDVSGTRTMQFPQRKFVYRVRSADISARSLYNKVLPEEQQKRANQLVRAIPLILGDELAVAEVAERENYADTDPAHRSAPAADGDSSSAPDYSVEEDVGTAGGRSRTRVDALGEMADMFNVVRYDHVHIREYRPEALTLQRNTIVDHLLEQCPATAETYSSCYAPIRALFMRNMEKMRGDIIRGRHGKGKFWSELTNPQLVARKLHLLTQQLLFAEYSGKCRTTESTLSPSGRQITDYRNKTNLYRHDVVRRKFDPTLTSFANQECRSYDIFEQVYLFNSAHRIMSLARQYAMDAYCVNFRRPHNNMLTHSDAGAVSKSYVWRILMEDLCIPRTTEVVTYETAKARATDEVNQNDGIVVFDELEKALIDKNSKGDSDKERMLKQLLSNSTVVVKTLVYDSETGKRTTKTTYAEWITVFFGSTNMDISCMSDAMARRWHVAAFDEKPGTHRAIVEMELASNIMSEEDSCDFYMAFINGKYQCCIAIFTLQIYRRTMRNKFFYYFYMASISGTH